MKNIYLRKLKYIPYVKKIYIYFKNKTVKQPTWLESLDYYSDWANKELSEEYREIVTDLLFRFNKFSEIKKDSKILDVGCGTNKIGNMTYKQFFGWDDSDNPNWIGIDPLVGRATVIGVAENMYMFKNNTFDKIQISTSLDHFMDWRLALKECLRVLKKDGDINIWFTDTKVIDSAHSVRVSLKDMINYNKLNPNIYLKIYSENWKGDKTSKTIFLKIRYVK